MPLTALGGSTGTVVIGNTSTSVFPQNLHPNVNAYIAAQKTAGYVMTRTEIDAVNNLVWGLVGAGIWDKIQVLYPCIGNATTGSNSFRLNIKDTASFNLTFNGSWTFASTGMKIASSTAGIWANTSFNPATSSTLGDVHFAMYIRNFTTVGNTYIGGNVSGTGFGIQMATTTASIAINQSGVNTISMTGVSGGMIIGSRLSASSVAYAMLNNNFRRTSLSAEAASFRSATIYLGGNNPQSQGGTIAEITLASIGKGLTEQDGRAFYVLTQVFQTELGRQA